MIEKKYVCGCDACRKELEELNKKYYQQFIELENSAKNAVVFYKGLSIPRKHIEKTLETIFRSAMISNFKSYDDIKDEER